MVRIAFLGLVSTWLVACGQVGFDIVDAEPDSAHQRRARFGGHETVIEQLP